MNTWQSVQVLHVVLHHVFNSSEIARVHPMLVQLDQVKMKLDAWSFAFHTGGKEEAERAYEEALNAVFDLGVDCHQHIQPYQSRKDGKLKWALLEMWPLLVKLLSVSRPCTYVSMCYTCLGNCQTCCMKQTVCEALCPHCFSSRLVLTHLLFKLLCLAVV